MKILLTLVFIVCHCRASPVDYGDSDEDGGSARFLSQFATLEQESCHYSGEEGLCMGETECMSVTGNYGDFCGGLRGICCIFHRTCNQRTRQRIAYFHNTHYPLLTPNLGDCTFSVVRRDNYCGLRLQARTEHLPVGENCAGTFLHIGGAGERQPLPLCGRRLGLDYTLSTRHVGAVSLTVRTTGSTSGAWKIKVTQVPCSEFDDDDNEQTVVAVVTPKPKPPQVFTTFKPITPNPTTARPTTPKPTTSRPTSTPKPTTPTPPTPPPTTPAPFIPAPTSPPAPPSSSGRCFSPRGPASTNVQQGPQSDFQSTQDLGSQLPFLRDAVYEKNHVSDSLFHFYAGPPSPFINKVTYGTNAGVREFPWQVAMKVNGRYHCGGSVIAEKFILTAAHCVVSYQNAPRRLKLSVGDWDLESTADGVTLGATVSKVHVNENYNRNNLQNDIAILELSKPIAFSDRVKPVCLPSPGFPTTGKTATITGWGRDEKRNLRSKLQKLTSTMVTTETCDLAWRKKKAPKGFIVDTMLCMDASRGDSCNGDSGGPLVADDGQGGVVLVGAVSFGSGSCTDANLPGVYTRVSEYIDWINRIVKN